MRMMVAIKKRPVMGKRISSAFARDMLGG